MINPLASHQDAVLEKVAERLGLALSMRGYSKLQFVEKINREEPTVRKWLSGKNNFRVDTLTELALALEIPLSFFFTDEPVSAVTGQHDTEGAVRHDTLPSYTLHFNPRRKVWELTSELSQRIYAAYSRKEIALSGRRIERAIGRGIVKIYDEQGKLQMTQRFPAKRGHGEKKDATI